MCCFRSCVSHSHHCGTQFQGAVSYSLQAQSLTLDPLFCLKFLLFIQRHEMPACHGEMRVVTQRMGELTSHEMNLPSVEVGSWKIGLTPSHPRWVVLRNNYLQDLLEDSSVRCSSYWQPEVNCVAHAAGVSPSPCFNFLLFTLVP